MQADRSHIHREPPADLSQDCSSCSRRSKESPAYIGVTISGHIWRSPGALVIRPQMEDSTAASYLCSLVPPILFTVSQPFQPEETGVRGEPSAPDLGRSGE